MLMFGRPLSVIRDLLERWQNDEGKHALTIALLMIEKNMTVEQAENHLAGK